MAQKPVKQGQAEDLEEDLPGGRVEGPVDIDLDEIERIEKEGDGKDGKAGDADRVDKGGDDGVGDRVARDVAVDDAALDDDQETAEQKEKRERRRREREARRQRLQDTEREVARLNGVVKQLTEGQKQMTQAQVADQVRQIDDRLARSAEQYAQAQRAKIDAVAKQDGKVQVEADELMAEAKETYAQLMARRRQIEEWWTGQQRGDAQTQDRTAKPQVSESLKASAAKFMRDHPWYKANGEDRDSAQVTAIDRKLYADNWDPNQAGYWDELARRVKREMPHKFKKGGSVDDELDEELDDDDRGQRRERQITGGSGREGGAGGKRTYHLSAIRVAALKEAGMWDDAKQRAKMIRIYQRQDEDARKNRSR